MIESSIVLAQVAGAAESGATVNPWGVVVVGFLFVIVVLALLASVTGLMGVFFTKQAVYSAERAAKAALKAAEASGATQGTVTASSPASAPAPDDDPVLAAVIAAAVHTVLGDRPHRVVSVRSSGPGWAQEGRRQIFSSHRVR